MSGTLKIHSNGSGEWLFGHSWIEFVPDKSGQAQTFGTWGNNPTGQGNGLFINLELGQKSDACRARQIDDAQETILFKKIESYRQMGGQAWSLLSPCSSFAEDIWESTTGENLRHQSVLVSTPSRLKESILEANRLDAQNPADTHAVTAPPQSNPGAPVDGPRPMRKSSKLKPTRPR